MAHFYADENFPLPVILELRKLGHDVLTTQEAGQSGRAIPDEQVLAFSAANNRALLTLNRQHFIRLHRASQRHSGILVCTFNPHFSEQAHLIDDAIRDAPTLDGILLRVNRG